MRFKVPSANLLIIDIDNKSISADIFCSNNSDPTDCDLFFAANFDPYSFSFYKIFRNSTNNLKKERKEIQLNIMKFAKVKLNDTANL